MTLPRRQTWFGRASLIPSLLFQSSQKTNVLWKVLAILPPKCIGSCFHPGSTPRPRRFSGVTVGLALALHIPSVRASSTDPRRTPPQPDKGCLRAAIGPGCLCGQRVSGAARIRPPAPRPVVCQTSNYTRQFPQLKSV